MTDEEPLLLTMWTGDDDQQTVEVPGPGGTVRVAVGRPGRRSGVWRVWANRGTSDVYVAGRTVAGIAKWSLHESGDWRHGFTSQFAKAAGIEQRLLDQWEAPEPDGAGWQRGLCIRVAAEDVVDIPADQQREDDVLWLPERLDGAMAYIHIIVARPNEGIAEGLLPVGAFRLADGRAVIVGVAWRVNTPEEQEALDELRGQAKARIPADLSLPPDPSGMRMSVLGFDEHGHRIVWDMAFPREALP